MQSLLCYALLGLIVADIEAENSYPVKYQELYQGVQPALHHPHSVLHTHPPPVPFERGPLNCTCPDTYSLVGQRCERSIRFPLESLCPTGYEQTDATNCVKEVVPEERCSYGYARVKTECIRREVMLPQLGCPANFTLEAALNWESKHHGDHLICSRRYPVDTEVECPDGTAASGPCYATVAVPANYTCPAGYLQGPANTCNRVTEVDCDSPTHPRLLQTNTATGRKLRSEAKGLGTTALYVFPEASAKEPGPAGSDTLLLSEIYNSDGSRSADRGQPPVGVEKVSNALQRAINELPGPPDPRTHFHNWFGHHTPLNEASLSLSVTHTCSANVTIEATPYCAAGELRGQLCAQAVPTQPVRVCPAFGTVDDCYAYERRNPRSECLPGFVRECMVKTMPLKASTIDCECVQTTATPVEILCPPGADFINGLCVFTTSPYSGCPLGTRLVNGACEELQYKPHVCTYTVNFACQGTSCSHHAWLKH